MLVVSSIPELEKIIAGYESLIGHYTLARNRMLDCRRGAADHVMVELDERLEANGRTLEALTRALDISREHLSVIQRRETAVRGGAPGQ